MKARNNNIHSRAKYIEETFENPANNNPEQKKLQTDSLELLKRTLVDIGDPKTWIYKFISEKDESPFSLEDWRIVTFLLNTQNSTNNFGVHFDFQFDEAKKAIEKRNQRLALKLAETKVKDFERTYQPQSNGEFTQDFLAFVAELSGEVPQLLQGHSSVPCGDLDEIRKQKARQCMPDEIYDSISDRCLKIQIQVKRDPKVPNSAWVRVMLGQTEIGSATCGFSERCRYCNKYGLNTYVTDVSINSKFQGQGLAGRLMDEVLKECSNFNGQIVKHLSLFTDLFNFPAIKLYYSRGFRILKHSNETVVMEIDKTP